MNEHEEKLVTDLRRLRAELEQAGQLHGPIGRQLDEILAGLQHKTSASAHEDALGNVRSAVEQFETEHPRATAILNDIMVTLSNMGI